VAGQSRARQPHLYANYVAPQTVRGKLSLITLPFRLTPFLLAPFPLDSASVALSRSEA
jgi:hypothetical protein